MYIYKILLFASLVLPIFAVPLQGSTILQDYTVVERSNDPVGDTILPSLPKREPVSDLVGRERRPGGGGFGPLKRSIEGVEKRKNRFNGGGFGNPKRRSDSLETRGILRLTGGWEAPPSDHSLETRGGRRGGGGGGNWVGRRSDNLEIREEADDDEDLVDEVDVDAFGFGGSKRGLRGTGGSGGHKRGLQRPGKGGGGKRGLKCPGSGGSKRGLTPACGGSK